MNIRSLAFGALALLASGAAKADVLFDSLDVPNNTANADGLYDGAAAMAVSFAGNPDFSSVNVSTATLLLGLSDPAGVGSSMVYLVPDDQSSAGSAGHPQATFPGGQFSGFSNAELIGTIADSSLAGGPTAVTLSFIPTVTSANDEFWIGIVPGGTSDLVWYYADNNTGSGTTGQESWYADTVADNPPAYATYADTNIINGGPYDLIVATPEPASLALLGAGLASLGFVRKRFAKKA